MYKASVRTNLFLCICSRAKATTTNLLCSLPRKAAFRAAQCRQRRAQRLVLTCPWPFTLEMPFHPALGPGLHFTLYRLAGRSRLQPQRVAAQIRLVTLAMRRKKKLLAKLAKRVLGVEVANVVQRQRHVHGLSGALQRILTDNIAPHTQAAVVTCETGRVSI